MNIEEIIKLCKSYFGGDRAKLKKKLLSFEFDGKDFDKWNTDLKSLTNQPFRVDYRIFEDFIYQIQKKKKIQAIT